MKTNLSLLFLLCAIITVCSQTSPDPSYFLNSILTISNNVNQAYSQYLTLASAGVASTNDFNKIVFLYSDFQSSVTNAQPTLLMVRMKGQRVLSQVKKAER